MAKDKIMKVGRKAVIAESVYNKTPNDYKGLWTTERWDREDWEQVRSKYIGKRTWMPPCDLFGGTCLLVEGLALEIIPDEEFTKRFGF